MPWRPNRCLLSRWHPTIRGYSTHQLRLSSTTSTPLTRIPRLSSWDSDRFRYEAFIPAKPYLLASQYDKLPPACSKWFIHDSDSSFDLNNRLPKSSELRTSFWSEHEQTLVPLELTSISPSSSTFHRSEAPLKILLAYLGNSPSLTQQEHAIYLAQCSLSSLPKSLQADIPTPSLVLSAGKGDVYESSLWLGRPPTYTPLHRDPNPNLFLQLAGRKVVRLLPPEVGDAIFEQVQEQLRSTSGVSDAGLSSAAFRGEEMMAGPERELLHRAVWEKDSDECMSLTRHYGQEAEVALGEALFIPKGWWHSIKGVGQGITASANWWFR